jgi:hypothetical protein
MAAAFAPLDEHSSLEDEHHAAPPAPRAALPDAELHALDGVRGLASLFIVVGHILTYWTPNEKGAAYPQFGLEVRALREWTHRRARSSAPAYILASSSDTCSSCPP